MENKIYLATFGQRSRAGILDYLIILPIFLYLLDKLASYLTQDIFYIYCVNDVFFILYFVLLQKIYSKTLGMKIIGLEMKRPDRTAVSLKQILIHNTPDFLFCLMELWNLNFALKNLPELSSRSNIELNLLMFISMPGMYNAALLWMVSSGLLVIFERRTLADKIAGVFVFKK